MTSPNSSENGTRTTLPARMSHQSLVSAAMPLLSGLRMSNGDPHDPAHGDLADAARRDRDRRNPDELAERDDRTGSDGRCRRERHVLALAVDHHGHWDLREVPTEVSGYIAPKGNVLDYLKCLIILKSTRRFLTSPNRTVTVEPSATARCVHRAPKDSEVHDGAMKPLC